MHPTESAVALLLDVVDDLVIQTIYSTIILVHAISSNKIIFVLLGYCSCGKPVCWHIRL